MKSTATYFGLAHITGTLNKAGSCSDQFIMISTSTSACWTWGPDGVATRFVWDCNSKVIYGISTSTAYVSCSGYYVYDITITFSGANLEFYEPYCGSLTLVDSVTWTATNTCVSVYRRSIHAYTRAAQLVSMSQKACRSSNSIGFLPPLFTLSISFLDCAIDIGTCTWARTATGAIRSGGSSPSTPLAARAAASAAQGNIRPTASMGAPRAPQAATRPRRARPRARSALREPAASPRAWVPTAAAPRGRTSLRPGPRPASTAPAAATRLRPARRAARSAPRGPTAPRGRRRTRAAPWGRTLRGARRRARAAAVERTRTQPARRAALRAPRCVIFPPTILRLFVCSPLPFLGGQLFRNIYFMSSSVCVIVSLLKLFISRATTAPRTASRAMPRVPSASTRRRGPRLVRTVAWAPCRHPRARPAATPAPRGSTATPRA